MGHSTNEGVPVSTFLALWEGLSVLYKQFWAEMYGSEISESSSHS
jgi:hypothetical protein